MKYKLSFIFLTLILLCLSSVYAQEPANIVFIGKASVVDDSGSVADSVFIDDLLAEGYSVTYTYPFAGSLAGASQGYIDTLNNADLVIIGRSGSSGDFDGADKPAWNALTSPVLLISPWMIRSNRLDWVQSTSIPHVNQAPDTVVAKISLPDDGVFADATLAADSSMDWAYAPHDVLEETDGGNGTVLARDASNSNILFIRWDPWTYYYEG